MNDRHATGLASIDNRRGDVRHALRYQVVLAGRDARTRNISASGVYVETDHPINVNQRIHFAVMLPRDPPELAAQSSVWCEGRVVWVDVRETGRVGVGVAFEHCYLGGRHWATTATLEAQTHDTPSR